MLSRSFPRERRRLLGLACAALLGQAGAHGQQLSDLRGVTLCLDPASVGVTFEELAPARAARARQEIEPALRQSLGSALKAAGVRHEVRASCTGQPGMTRWEADVRYLNPRNYVGFGDPAYSYQVFLFVGDPASVQLSAPGAGSARGFAVDWADIHSESRTGQPFEPVVLRWGEEQMRDLVVAWRRDNPTLAERFARQGPLTLGLLGLGLGTLLTGAGLWLARRRRPRERGARRRGGPRLG
ncbi:hypothetical protein DAERI_020238 [Deinococcus aerius]|uniref:Uncharacterized protein n=2 Tax=Deinococcus TaxID=1298 RepID=A0A2I9DIR2_9DEIO|nr:MULTISPECIES: hypothetical protein [Deinococcus]MBB5293898.1 hypothetical protein [Deinococcus metallilatus]QBY07157.1 hypothetical protein E5F05_04025 [Deinococcus metallilatus]RXJ14629.1 hypothetical protein ERJ73_02755 [Deinococcus metallilatus]TLK30749.1 hypothetical protein FCS05_03070 [Deinococcus metallilatus]GBF04641.1 hypothetical protein DAERI_020238 [Deinococcus aerius]